MNFLIVGGGSIGKRHLKNLLFLSQKVFVVEPVKERAKEIERKFNVKVYGKLEDALKISLDAALICNPTVYHLKSALKIANKKIHLFIEKPLSHNLKNVNHLIDIVKRKRLYVFLGSNFKFHPSFILMKKLLEKRVIGKTLSFTVIAGQYLPDWHPYEDYRKGYSANRRLGGGALLDSHEFDYLQWLLAPVKKIACFTKKYSALDIDTEDIAESIVELKNGVVGNIHVDYIQRPYRRIYYFYGEKGAIEWDYAKKTVSLYEADKKKWKYFRLNEKYDSNNMYIDEIRHFIRVLEGDEKPLTDIFTALKILKVLDAAKKSSRMGKTIKIR